VPEESEVWVSWSFGVLAFPSHELPPCNVSWQNEFRLRFAIKCVEPGQIRDRCAQVSLQVVAIRRLRIGKVSLAKMPVSEWR
jgi:23S rRNA pseudouridine2604 synthase